jgi:hypothetical protein
MSRTTKQSCVLVRGTPKVTQNQPAVMCLGNNYPCIFTSHGGTDKSRIYWDQVQCTSAKPIKGFM